MTTLASRHRHEGTTPPDAGGFPSLALGLVAGLVVLSLLYPFLLYERGVGASLSATSTTLFWIHVTLAALGLFTAVACRSLAFLSVQLFNWFFFVVAAREQLIFAWDPIFQLPNIMEIGLTHFIVFDITLLASYLTFFFLTPRALSRPIRAERRLAPASRLYLLLTGCLLLDLALLAYFGPTLFSSRQHFTAVSGQLFPAQLNPFFLQFIRPMLYFIPLFILRAELARPDEPGGSRRFSILIFSLICVIMGYLFNTPIISPRFHAGTILVGTVMLIVGPRRLSVLIAVVVVGIMVAPMFHIFRNAVVFERGETGLSRISFEEFRSFDFDAFPNHFYGVYYVEEFGRLDGMNLLSSIFFFVPSAVWSAKLTGSGAIVVEEAVWQLRAVASPKNSAMPLTGEGALAFGLAGVVLVAVVFAAVLRWLDAAPIPRHPAHVGFYPRAAMVVFAPILLFFITRGALLPTTAYSTATLLALAVAALVVTRPATSVAGSERPGAARTKRPPGARWTGVGAGGRPGRAVSATVR